MSIIWIVFGLALFGLLVIIERIEKSLKDNISNDKKTPVDRLVDRFFRKEKEPHPIHKKCPHLKRPDFLEENLKNLSWPASWNQNSGPFLLDGSVSNYLFDPLKHALHRVNSSIFYLGARIADLCTGNFTFLKNRSGRQKILMRSVYMTGLTSFVYYSYNNYLVEKSWILSNYFHTSFRLMPQHLPVLLIPMVLSLFFYFSSREDKSREKCDRLYERLEMVCLRGDTEFGKKVGLFYLLSGFCIELLGHGLWHDPKYQKIFQLGLEISVKYCYGLSSPPFRFSFQEANAEINRFKEGQGCLDEADAYLREFHEDLKAWIMRENLSFSLHTKASESTLSKVS